MSHYHCEILIPPDMQDAVEYAVAAVLAPFDENNAEEEARHSFWDWYVIGGRWSGAKTLAAMGQERVDAFYERLRTENVTVSGLQAGKPELSPASQKQLVDEACPLFKSEDEDGVLKGDISRVADLPPALSCERVIISGYDYTNKIVPVYMVAKSHWNGVTHQEAAWDGTVTAAINGWSDRLATYAEKYRERNSVAGEWLAVTVDYHS